MHSPIQMWATIRGLFSRFAARKAEQSAVPGGHSGGTARTALAAGSGALAMAVPGSFEASDSESGHNHRDPTRTTTLLLDATAPSKAASFDLAETAAPLRVLTLDGGGIRGVATLRVLRALEQQSGKRIHELFDIIGGTSTGGILAVLLGALNLPVAEVETLYEQLGKVVFDITLFGKIVNGVSENAQFSSDTLQEAIKDVLKAQRYQPDVKFYELRTGPRVFVVTNRDNVDYRFRNYGDGLPASGTSDIEVWKALRATSAAPTYFRPLTIGPSRFVDGGVGCNNPSFAAICEVRDTPLLRVRSVGIVVSVGTGKASFNTNDGQFVHLASFLSNAITDTEKVHDMMTELSRGRFVYERFNPTNMGDFNLADVKFIATMRGAADAYVRSADNISRLRRVAGLLNDPAGTLRATVDAEADAAASPQPATAEMSDGMRKQLLAFGERFHREEVDRAVQSLARLQRNQTLTDFVQQYAHYTTTVRDTGIDDDWTVSRKTARNFWEDFVLAFDEQLDDVLAGPWLYRAQDYLRSCEMVDAANFYRWRLDLANCKDYWDGRPKSYERISAILISRARRTLADDATVRQLIMTELKPAVLEVVGAESRPA